MEARCIVVNGNSKPRQDDDNEADEGNAIDVALSIQPPAIMAERNQKKRYATKVEQHNRPYADLGSAPQQKQVPP